MESTLSTGTVKETSTPKFSGMTKVSSTMSTATQFPTPTTLVNIRFTPEKKKDLFLRHNFVYSIYHDVR